MLKKTLLTIFSLFWLSLFFAYYRIHSVRAQQVVGSNFSEDYKTDKQSLLALYRQQIQVYQETYRRYDIALTQYAQLGTIASLGELVDLARETMKIRGEVVITYVDVLHLELRVATDVDQKTKQELLDKLQQLHTDLEIQQSLINNSQDYKAINSRSEAFTGLIADLESLSLKTKALIYTGKVDGFFLQAQKFYQEIELNYKQNPGSNIRAVERQRARDQITDAFEKLELLRSELAKLALREDSSQSWYTGYLTNLGAVQNQLLLIFAYLGEASQL